MVHVFQFDPIKLDFVATDGSRFDSEQEASRHVDKLNGS
ncbi:gp024 [Rhodococcus phage ReqiPepy6]|uniref:Gp024 n=1 Tax=Rhodococcus phage ReqiPepy6 TaxID=691965 RepID=D4P7D5_9CAUD|nr:gp024 [Rhodococcus phage ReqiPepy6]ADD80915.1 gp024 [Rhodococcus phage ReqiPepy6]